MKSGQVVCYGELLIDMISSTTGDLTQSKSFLKKFGGAPANVSMGVSKLGIPVSFMGKVGNDPFGKFLKFTLDSHNVNTDNLILSDNDKTTLAFVSLDKNGQRDFFFYRGAHEAITSTEVTLPKNTFLFHFGSLTQTNNTAYNATDKLIKQAKEQKTIISYDPNIRESLWGNLNLARDVILATAKKVNILKVNEEEALLLANTTSLEEAGKKLFIPSLDALFITMGPRGCFYKTASFENYIPTIKLTPIDTTGAGDAFNAGYISLLFDAQKRIPEMSQAELEAGLKRSNVIASLTTTKKGAISAFPTQKQLKEALSSL
ncbi:MAG TPA: carbohydrate kinase [Patescibacteria group bacterium]|nr:carbohydrate kinase [Patescibacteria group bacterium]